jgi:hypothetical protein
MARLLITLLIVIINCSGCKNPLGGSDSFSSVFCSGNTDPTIDEECNLLTTEPSKTILSWDFLNPSDYYFNSTHIDVSGGNAHLKKAHQDHSGAHFTSGNHVGTHYSHTTGQLTLLTQQNLDLTNVNNILPEKSSNLLGYWRFDGDFKDSSTNDSSATKIGNVLISSKSKMGTGALSLDGNNEFLQIDENTSINLINNEVTYSFWVKPNTDNDFCILSKILEPGSGWQICRSAGQNLYFYLNNGVVIRSRSNPFPLKEWRHVAIVYSSSLKKIYVNGLDMTESVSTQTFVENTVKLSIGAKADGNYSLVGLIDEVAIWDTALSHDEIISLYSIQNANYTELSSQWTPKWDQIIGYWKMDGNWLDSSGKNQHVSAQGNANFTVNSKIGTHSGIFSSSGDHASKSGVDLSNMTQGTMSIWVKSSTPSSTNSRFLEIGQTSNRVGLILDSSQITHLYIVKSTVCLDLTTSIVINDGGWHHLAATYSASGAQLYINGKQVATSPTNCSGNYLPSSSKIMLGQFVGGGNYEWRGQLDDAAIWSTALTRHDIQLIYNRQKSKYSGYYESSVIDLGISGKWSQLDAVTTLPFGKEFVVDAIEDSNSYPAITGNLGTDVFAHWNFRNNFVDTINPDRNFVTVGTPSFSQGIIPGKKSVQLNNSSFAYHSGVDYNLSTQVSISAWIKVSSLPSTLHGAGVFSVGQSGINDGAFELLIINTSSELFGFFRTRGTSPTTLISTHKIPLREWVHLVVTYNGDRAKFYINGKIDSEQIRTGNLWNNANCLAIGRRCTSGSFTTGIFTGSIDQLTVWDKELNPAEITQLYRRSSNRISYQVKSCVDSSCNCKALSISPAGSPSDCDGDGIPNQIDSEDPYKAKFIGPGGDSLTYYNETFNRSINDINFNCNANISDSDDEICLDDEISFLMEAKANSPFFKFEDMAPSADITNNRYFQYRVFMESDNNTACAGEPCLPELTQIKVEPIDRYYAGRPIIRSLTSHSYDVIHSIKFETAGECEPTYQLSSNGTVYYYYNGSSWEATQSDQPAFSSNASDIENNIKKFSEMTGAGNLYFKAFLHSDTNETCQINKISISK